MTKILFTDIDGTLLDDNKEIPEKNRKAIDALIAGGHKIVLTTGRALSSTVKQAQKLGLTFDGCYIIAFNGGLIYDSYNQKTLYRSSMPLDVVAKVFEIAEAHGIHAQTYDETYVLAKTTHPDMDRYCREVTLEAKVDPELPSTLKEEPAKILLLSYDGHEKLIEMQPIIEEATNNAVDTFFSREGLLEVVMKGTNKGVAIQKLCSLLSIPLENSVGAGDGNNDVPLIESAHMGCAMKNAVDPAKAAANYITELDNNEGGLAEIIEKFIL